MTTVAFSSSELATRGISPLRATVSTVCGAWRSLVSTSRWPPRCQPLRRRGGHPPQDVEPVRAAVERHPRLVQAGLRRQQPDRPRWVRRARWRPGRRRGPAARRAAARRGHLRTPGHRRRRRCGGRTAPRRGRCRRRATRPGPGPRPARRPPRPSRSTGRRRRPCGRGPAAGRARRARAAAWRTRNSVRRRGTKTPGSTAIRRPQNSAQPRTCSSGRPATRRSTMAARSAGVARRGDEQPRLVLGEDAAGGPEPGGGGRLVMT